MVSPCPMWSSPVTFGGGMMTTYGFFERSTTGVKYPPSTQES